MIKSLVNIKLIFRGGRAHALTHLRQCTPIEMREFIELSIKCASQASIDANLDDDKFLDNLSILSIEAQEYFNLEDRAKIWIEYTSYKEHVGHFRDGIRIGLLAVDFSTASKNINLRRRAHSLVAGHCLRVCQFQMACTHLEAALRLARQMGNPFFEGTILCNISVLFNAMGLLHDSIKISLRVLSWPAGNHQLETIQFFNAINALESSLSINDSVTSAFSYRIACRKFKNPNLLLNNVVIANFEYCRALYLINQNKWRTATKHINDAIIRFGSVDNRRIYVMLHTARALCASASRKPTAIRVAKRTLKRLLNLTKDLSPHHEEVLRGLIQVYSAERTVRSLKTSLRYGEQLREYVLDAKYDRFSFQIDDITNSGDDKLEFSASRSKNKLLSRNDAVERRSSGKADLNDIYEGLVTLRDNVAEDRFRTGAYAVAEEWALAAEFIDDNSGRHCFRVGKIAGALALYMGIPTERCVEIDLACRLHDIGKIAINEVTFRKSRGLVLSDHQSIIDHALAGARLLSSSVEPIFKIASAVAMHHHEWWNGCGYPQGLKGELIPLEARICAIADTYDTLTHPEPGIAAWTHKEAVQQICAMAGVQLDLNLISPFLQALEGAGALKERVAIEVDQSMERNQLARAKRKLFETLELVD